MRFETGLAQALQTTFYAPGTEDKQDADGTVHALVKHVNGTTLLDADATSLGAGSGEYQVILPAQTDPLIGHVTWTGVWGGLTQTRDEYFEVIERFMIDLWEIRQLEGLENRDQFPTEVLVEKREAAEDLFQMVTGPWTVNYAMERLDGDSSYRRAYMAVVAPWVDEYTRTRRLVLANKRPLRILSVTVNGVIDAAPPGYAGGQAQYLADQYKLYESGELERGLSSDPWPRGVQNVVIEYLYGRNSAPAELKEALRVYIRELVLRTKSRVSSRATMFTTAEGGSVALGTALDWERPTGITEVDAVLSRYNERELVIA